MVVVKIIGNDWLVKVNMISEIIIIIIVKKNILWWLNFFVNGGKVNMVKILIIVFSEFNSVNFEVLFKI